MKSQTIELLRDIKDRSKQDKKIRKTFTHITVEEIQSLDEDGMLVSGEEGGIIVADGVAVPVIMRTPEGYVFTALENYSYILNDVCTRFMLERYSGYLKSII